MQGVAAGEITPSEAAALSKLVDAHGNAIKLADLAERLARIEAARRTSAPTALRGSSDRRRSRRSAGYRGPGELATLGGAGQGHREHGRAVPHRRELTAEARVARFGTEA